MPIQFTDATIRPEHPAVALRIWVSDFANEQPDDGEFDFDLNPGCGWADAVFTPTLAAEIGQKLLDYANEH